MTTDLGWIVMTIIVGVFLDRGWERAVEVYKMNRRGNDEHHV